MKQIINNIAWVVAFLAVIATIILGIWWEPFPFWKVAGTEALLIFLYRIFYN